MRRGASFIVSVLVVVGSVGHAFQSTGTARPAAGRETAGRQVIRRIIAKQAVVPDTGVTLLDFGQSYYLDPGTIVFWGYIGEQRFSAKYTGPMWGLFSWKGGTVKTVFLEGDKVKSLYGPDELNVSVSNIFFRNTYVKRGKGLLYIDLVRRRVFGGDSRCVYTWDGDRLTRLLGGKEEVSIGGQPRVIDSADTLSITPDGNAVLRYVTKGVGIGLLVHRSGALDPLYANKDPLPDVPGVHKLDYSQLDAANVADDGIAIKFGATPLAQATPDVLMCEVYHGSGSVLDEAFLGMSEERKYSGAPQDRRPIVFPACILAQVEAKGMPTRLVRMGKDSTETILRVADPDPSGSASTIDKIDGFNASSPETILVKAHIKKGNAKLLLTDKGKFTAIHEFKPGRGGGEVGREFLMGNTLFLGPGSNTFLYFMKTWLTGVQYPQETRLVSYSLHYYDGQRLWDIASDAPLGELSSLRLVPDGSGRTIVQICAPNKGFSQCTRWLFSSASSTTALVPVPEIAMYDGTKLTLADMIGVDDKGGKTYFELLDGFYVMDSSRQ